MRWKPTEIKRKILVIAILPAAIVTIMLTVLFSVTQTNGLEQSLNERGFAIVRQLSPASEFGVFSGNKNILQSLVETVKNEADVRSVSIRNVVDKVLISIGDNILPSFSLDLNTKQPQMIESTNGQSRIFYAPIFQTEFTSSSQLDSELSLENSDTPMLSQTNKIIGWVTVELSMQRTLSYQITTWSKSGLIALIVLVFSGFLAIRMGRNIANPIIELKDAINEVESGNLKIKVSTNSSGELLALEKGINAMAKALHSSRTEMEISIEQATSDLRDAMHVLEERNTELDTARHEAESANQIKSSFLANISHEIRTPLNGIQGFLLLLSKTVMTPSQRGFIDNIEVSTKTLLTLINDILDFSKLEAAKVSIAHIEFDIRELIHESVSACVPESKNKNLELIVNIDADIPTRLIGGADRIAQIVKNLVSNAVKFTNQGHILVQVTRPLQSGFSNVFRISVTDTGIGIPAEDRDQLFQPFAQIETGMTRRYSGTGLGLVISKSLVELMGGSITVDSIPNVGSSFSFNLPLEVAKLSDIDHTRIRILDSKHAIVISDNQLIRRSLITILDHWGIISDAANDIEQASRLFQSAMINKQPYDCIFVDETRNNNHIEFIIDQAPTLTTGLSPCFIMLKPTIDQTSKLREEYLHRVNFITRPAYAYEITNILCHEFSNDTDTNKTYGNDKPSYQNRTYQKYSLRILIADDNPINLEFLSTWLNQVGCEIDKAKDGNEAVQYCTHTKYDLVLLDLHMPKMDGIDAATWIRENSSASKDTPIVVVTADTTDNTKTLINNSLVNDCLIKPITETSLFQIIDKWCPETKIQSNSQVNTPISTELNIDDSVVNETEGLRLASGNAELWIGSLRMLTDRFDEQKSGFIQAIEIKNHETLFDLSHSIVGAASYCGAIHLQTAATQLEKVARKTDWSDIVKAYNNLEKEMVKLSEWFKNRSS